MYDLGLMNGTCWIFHQGSLRPFETHLYIKEGKIATISQQDLPAKSSVSVHGLQVFPGVIDSQVHFRDPGMPDKEDLSSGSRAAAFGGVTSFFDMPNTSPATTTEELFLQKIHLGETKSWVDFGFYIGASCENLDQLPVLEKLPGCAGIKIFLGSSTGSLLIDDDTNLEKIFQNTHGLLIFHSEDEQRLKQRKHLAIDSSDVHQHPHWRDPLTALISTQKIIRLAEKFQRQIHILHISTAEEVDFLKDKKRWCTTEVLPQHLTLFAPDCYDRLGTLAQQNPPLRELHHQQALWQAVLDGTIDIMGSDHAPHTLLEKAKTYPNSPSGMPGVQTMVPLMLNFINQGKISLPHWLNMVTEMPRKTFRCFTKGRIEVGLDADFTIVDLKKEMILENSWIQSRCGWTAFDGMKVQGTVHSTYVRGQALLQESAWVAGPSPRGQKVSFFLS